MNASRTFGYLESGEGLFLMREVLSEREKWGHFAQSVFLLCIHSPYMTENVTSAPGECFVEGFISVECSVDGIGRVRPPPPYPGAVATRSKFYFPIGRNWFCWVHGLTIPVLPRDNFKEWLFMSSEEADWLYKDMFCSLCSSEKYGVLLFMHDAQGRGFPNVVQASGYCMCNHKMRRAL